MANGGQTGWASNGYVADRRPAGIHLGRRELVVEFVRVRQCRRRARASTWAMLGIGFLGLASVATRRSRKDRLAPGLA